MLHQELTGCVQLKLTWDDTLEALICVYSKTISPWPVIDAQKTPHPVDTRLSFVQPGAGLAVKFPA